ncbi:hypothetical protein FMM05_17005 [Flavobacterium zepuense]|uniref:Uncharacterized protein n=1 Tax=Flavobacterium zepuense TaxID=2593302 RepID=A0A552UWJ1_9FLAO|nr:hypothetical protein [Flavobacterium zepuense]TRW22579.1 hypothetical protein FMM05_17005 [Flavobacterium zepuense]
MSEQTSIIIGLIILIPIAYIVFFIVSYILMVIVGLIVVSVDSKKERNEEEDEASAELLNEVEYGEYVQWAAINNKPLLFDKVETRHHKFIKSFYFEKL